MASVVPSENNAEEHRTVAKRMHVLALEPYYGGSHRAFLDGWIEHSQHQFTVLGLPAYKWKWRMRHAAVTFANQLREPKHRDKTFDVLWCSDMLNLAEFLGLATHTIQALPTIAYFHENQLTYPVREEPKRDFHFAYSNFMTCQAAQKVWFNSQFHKRDFANALENYLKRMPDFQHAELVDSLRAKSSVQHPGVCSFPVAEDRQPGPLRIAWNARWEHDKNPDAFFDALRILQANQFPFELIVLGESFRNSPAVFESARHEFASQLRHWGYAESVEEYRRIIGQADVVASTANHEFFGIGIVEAMSAGVIPLVPNRLAYPDVLACCEQLPLSASTLLYGQSAHELAARIAEVAKLLQQPNIRTKFQSAAQCFFWQHRAHAMDEQLAMLL